MRGNLLIAHGGGPTAVLNASLYGALREAQQHAEVQAIYGARFGAEGLLAADYLDLRRQPRHLIEALPYTPGSALGSSRQRVEPGDGERMITNLRANNVRSFLFTGGNGTMLAAGQLARLAAGSGYELSVIGVPKTVDNDLAGTDHCPGYGSAARYMAISALELGLDNESLPFPIDILETMGRNTGWLAAATMLAAKNPDQGPQLVYVPEIPFDPEHFLRDVEAVYRRWGRALVVAAEGLRDDKGGPVYYSSQATDRDGFGHPLPGNVGIYLAGLVSRELKLRVRNDKPGLCARASMACASPVDREEAVRCGEAAVRHALAGATGIMVTLEREPGERYECRLGTVPLEEVGARERSLPREFMNDTGNYPTEAFRNYARPLVGGGLPEYAGASHYGRAVRRPVAP